MSATKRTFEENDPVSFEDNEGETVEGTVDRVLDGDVFLVKTEEGIRGVPAELMRSAGKRPKAKED